MATSDDDGHPRKPRVQLRDTLWSVQGDRERLKHELFEQLLHAADPDAWKPIADRLAPRRGHLQEIARHDPGVPATAKLDGE